jgi:hypothetical protein
MCAVLRSKLFACNLDGLHVMRSTNLIFRHKSGCFSSLTGRAKVQTVIRLLTAETWVRSKFSPRLSSDGQNDTGAGFSPSTWAFPCQNNSHNSPHSSSSTRCSYQDSKRSKFGKLPKIKAPLLSRGTLNRNMFLYFREELGTG